MMKQTLIGSVILAAVAAGPAWCAENIERGAGAGSCAAFAEAYAANPVTAEAVYFSWAQGFMTGANIAAASASHRYSDLGGVAKDQQARIRAFCAAHPAGPYAEAVFDLYKSLPEKSLGSN